MTLALLGSSRGKKKTECFHGELQPRHENLRRRRRLHDAIYILLDALSALFSALRASRMA
jgi:hypothetical protein